ncbi:MAG: hypothetical protein H7228_15260 [Polaromonas sp.]|nr:hypothetical protein [Polaromonas sp.]
MKASIRHQVAALFFLLPVAAAISALPATAMAQPAMPELRSLQVASDGGFTSGADLEFTVEATPRGQASVRIRGVQRNIPLREVSRGVYTGEYTVRRQDRITETSPIRATIKVRNRSASADYSFPAGFSGAPVAVVPPAPAAPPPAVLKIDRFAVTPVEKIEPGAELRFLLNGMAGAVASFDIPGVIDNVAMRETRPGVYEGNYTIRRLDNLAPSRPIVARLRMGDKVVTSTLAQPLTIDAKAPVLRNLTPREGEVVAGNVATSVSASFDDAGGVGVDPKSVRILLSGRNVTGESNITAQFFSYRADLPPGRYTVDVSAKDLVGNAMSKVWIFDVARPAAAAPTTVPLQITSHANNAVVEGNSTTVRGRTAPGASVEVKVTAIAPLAGLFGVTQDVLSERVQADGSGNFGFSFSPRLPLPGTRYEITMNSRSGDLTTESRLVLFQKQN